MRIENLYEGQIIKNYKELCKILDIEERKTGSNSHKYQLKELNRYFSYSRDGHKYIIEEIYDSIKDKVDNRVNNKGGNNKIFSDDIERLILHMLVNNKNGRITISKGQLYKSLNMINENYLLGMKGIHKLSEITEVPQDAIYEFYDYNSVKLRSTVERNLIKLRNKALIHYNNTITIATYEVMIAYNELDQPIVHNGKIMYNTKIVHRLATEDEIRIILDTEMKTLEEMGLDSMQDVFLKGKWKKFKKITEEKLHANNTNILYYYDTYTIVYNKKNIHYAIHKLESEDIRNIESNINTKMVESIKKSTMKRHNKACLEAGLELDIYKQVKYLEQEKIEYVINQEQLTLTLISENARPLKEEFNKPTPKHRYKEVKTNSQQMEWDENIPF